MKFRLKLSRFDNSKLVAFGQALNDIVKGLTGFETVLTPFQSFLLKCVDAINNVAEKTKAKEISEMIKSEDGIRDDLVIGINKSLDAYEYHPDETVRVAASEISKIIAKIGYSIYKESYDEESALIKNVLTDLKGDYATQAETCHITPFVTALDQSQTRFDEYRAKQINENADINQIVAMSTIRRDFEKSIRKVLDVLPVMQSINPTAEQSKAINLVKELIRKYNY
ncbi:MAG: DUF6261 family protein [Bacteroidales bacterium]|nr:DUF6261 family protein [Bacteroidales bacterium]